MLTANILLRYCSRTAHEEEIRKLQFLNKHHVFPDPDVCSNMGKISRYQHIVNCILFILKPRSPEADELRILF